MLPTFAAEPRCSAIAAEHRRPQLLIDISCPHGAQQQTRRPLLLLLINVTDSWTDGSSTISQILFCIPFRQHQ